jgi:site-specific recombinase XerD
MVDPASVEIRGPLKVHVAGLWAELMRQGYAPLSALRHVQLAAHLDRWLCHKRLALDDLTEEVVAAFLRHRRRRWRSYYTSRGLAPLLGYLRTNSIAPGLTVPVMHATPAERLVQEYAKYLEQERGLTADTIASYSRFARIFIAGEHPGMDWPRLTAAQVSDFIIRRSRSSSRATCHLAVAHLRSFLRFLHFRGLLARDLAATIPAVAKWRLSALPSALEDKQVATLMKSFAPSPVGRRDAAIIRLLVRLGLRASEAAALRIEDVNWREGEIVVRGKGRRESRLPLPPDVGRALAAYLRWGRPRSNSRSIFLVSHAPYNALLPGAVIALAERALRRSGIRTGGAHLLRHTAATLLLRMGASLTEIGHVLRHRDLGTTAIYAKVDLASLGAVARPWPGGTR